MWRVLSEGLCTVTTLRDQTFDPAMYLDPFQNRRGKTYTLASGQLDGIFQFDANFFGISPREAAHIDPQQRLMLQTVWEAIEDAGLSPRELAGERTGVFVGSSIVENLSLYYADTARSGSSFSLGNTLCIIANRVSSFFDFGGPSYVLDAACASSLYALHQAAEAIRTGQVDTAIVGGVHALLTPGGFVGFSQARMLSPTGLCRAFDASADGYVRSEACVALVLQSPEAARRMMARTRARVLATGANTDGAASQLTVPSSARQETLMDAVMLRSGRDPDDLTFYEAHGTGTQVGDPVEARSIGRSMGMLRSEPLLVGSAKTNFGHAEPAAGLIGMAKVLLAMQNRALPASLHFTTPNPNIDFSALNLEVNTSLRPLPETGALLTGVNSFGFGGTNVSVMIESDADRAPSLHPVAALPAASAPRWLLLSAASDASLAALAQAWAEPLEQAAPDEAAAMAAAAAARADLPHRLALPLNAKAPARLRGIGALGTIPDDAPEGVQLGLASFARSRTVLAFPGNGAQIPGMGVPQYRDDQVFRAAFDEVAKAMEAEGVADLVGLMHAPDLAERLASPLVAQPLLFGFQVALTRSLCDAGLRMDAVIGHSVGEIAALHIAGCFDLAAAARIIVSRSRAFESLRGKGSMAVVAAAEADVDKAIRGLDEADLAIAAVNSPRSATVAGPVEALSRLARVTVAGKRLPMVRLKIEIPYHSPQVEPLRQMFLDDLAGLRFAEQQVAVGASALGRVLRAGECGIDYLWRNARDTVRFSDAMTALTEDGPCTVVEMAPTPVIQGNIRDMARYGGAALDHFLPLDGTGEGQTRDQLIARAWSRGVGVRHEALAGPRLGPAPQMPLYPWDEAEFRTELSPDGLDAWGEEGLHNLVGRRADRDTAVWVSDFTETHPRWIADHKVGGNIVLAGALLAELALGAATELWPDSGIELRHFDILAPTAVEGDGVRIRTQIDPASGTVTIQQRPRLTEARWLTVARGVVRKIAAPAALRPQMPRGAELPVDDLYDFLTSRGLAYGPAFRRMATAQSPRRDTVWISLGDSQVARSFILDPTALDGAFHGLAAIARGLLDQGATGGDSEMAEALREGAILLPTRMGRLHLLTPGAAPAHARLQVTRLRRRSLLAAITLHDATGVLIARLDDAEFTMVRLDAATRIPATRLANRQVRLRSTSDAVRLPRGWSDPKGVLGRLGAVDLPTATDMTAALSGLRTAPPEAEAVALRQALTLAPGLADDLRALMIARRGGEARDTALYGVAQQLGWAEARRILGQIAPRWPAGQRLSLLMIGLPDVPLLRQLVEQPGLDRVAVTAPDAETRSLLMQVLPVDLTALIDDAPDASAYDIVLAVGDCARREWPADWLAPGGLALMLDLPDLATDPDDTGLAVAATGFLNGGLLPLRLRVWRKPAATTAMDAPAIRPLLLGPLPTSLPDPLAAQLSGWRETSGKPTHRILVHAHRAGDTIAASLTDALMALKTHVPQGEAPLILLAVDLAGDADFPVLAAGLRSAVVTASNEFGDRQVRLLALHRAAQPSPHSLTDLIGRSDAEIALHASPDGLEAERLVPLAPAPQAGAALGLRQRDVGRLNSLEWRPIPKPRLRAGEVEVEIAATGLNFRDVMSARGLLSERILDAGASGAGMGMECAGIVRRCGPGVRLAPGARVMGFARSAFASHLVLPEAALSELPEGVALEAAAGLPVAFVTAWEALCNLARLSAGETVLIHGGAGGVGLAAIQIARAQGARVLATAGTEEKRALARAYGAEQVFNSRDLAFADEVMA
ncbi:MAG: beta-ketoacyl synthase N-terminal-like domain-containing protein, partial [Paracoccus sp. (in: a-proteobacteria)]